jgi:hypothetical protein
VLLTAIFSVHLPYGFLSIKLITVTAAGARFGPPGYETDPLYLACLAALVLGGPGPLAIDNLIGKRSGVGDLLEKRTKLNARISQKGTHPVFRNLPRISAGTSSRPLVFVDVWCRMMHLAFNTSQSQAYDKQIRRL